MQEYLNQIINDKWENVLPQLPDACIDLVLTDPPYNTTQSDFDRIPLDLHALWEELIRVAKFGAAFVFTASQPFTTRLIMSNYNWFKYDVIWHKTQATGHLNARVEPMREHEEIIVFGQGKVTYNPQIKKKKPENIRPFKGKRAADMQNVYGDFKSDAPRSIEENETYPRSVIQFSNAYDGSERLHPNQKPLELMEYLVRTYSNPGATVLDCFAGSGTTAIAAYNTGRNFICVEQDFNYWQKAAKRLQDVQRQMRFDAMVG